MDEQAIQLPLKEQYDAFTSQITALNKELQTTKSLAWTRHGSGSDYRNVIPRSMCLDVPKFNGTDPDDWIFSITNTLSFSREQRINDYRLLVLTWKETPMNGVIDVYGVNELHNLLMEKEVHGTVLTASELGDPKIKQLLARFDTLF
ncbi:hypothetical protein Tco_0032044 [Tanacetum coccineum]